ncbi:MAG: GHKL domain-containing protein [Oscillospiraceae bacterium]|nr:GHKL domain-containing protein [Oscillospiraceae bacterium]
MAQTLLFYIHSCLLLIFGSLLSLTFSGIRLSRKSIPAGIGLCTFSGILQLLVYVNFQTSLVWKLYPLISHLPIVLFLVVIYRKSIITALAALFTAYLFCQPAKWFGVLTTSLFQDITATYAVQIICLLGIGFLSIRYFAPYFSQIFNKDRLSICIFGIVPTVYYAFDYVTGVYFDISLDNNHVVAEFLPFFLCIVFLVFCVIYYKEYEEKADAERKEQIVRIVAQQQTQLIGEVKQSEQELRMLRHDMRLFLDGLSVCIQNRNTEKALEMVSAYCVHIDNTRLTHFCEFDAINYILSAFAGKCENAKIAFEWDVTLTQLNKDELLFGSILLNALDNAYNAQQNLDSSDRRIQLLLKNMGNKLLLSVKNPAKKEPIFRDGFPVSQNPGHGYGTQSIRYLSERLGGTCQFTFHDHWFILRVLL